MRVQLTKFFVGIVLVLLTNSAAFAQGREMVRHFDDDKKLKPAPAKLIAAIPDLSSTSSI